MTAGLEKQNSVLIVSGSEHARESIAGVLSPARFLPVAQRGSAAEARRLVLDTPFSLVFINSPLPDEFGTQLALDLAVRDGRIKLGDLVVLEAMGGGFTWGAAILRV